MYASRYEFLRIFWIFLYGKGKKIIFDTLIMRKVNFEKIRRRFDVFVCFLFYILYLLIYEVGFFSLLLWILKVCILSIYVNLFLLFNIITYSEKKQTIWLASAEVKGIAILYRNKYNIKSIQILTVTVRILTSPI